MPAGVKPITCVGKKGKSGRKKKHEELAVALEEMREEITNEALLKLSKSNVYKAMVETGTKSARDLSLPIVLKGMTDKKEINVLNMTQLLKSLNE